MKRGDVWTVRDAAYASKARPAVVVQADHISEAFQSVVLVGLTTFAQPDASARARLEPTDGNGLKETSYVMTEKPFTVRPERLGTRLGTLTNAEMRTVARGLAQALAITSDDLGAWE
jgi:mRNA interferase MazF